ncbi:MAG: TolC family protein [Desulfobacterales bacterium]|nr:TolC family protein [Desulfobacterales bacterium]
MAKIEIVQTEADIATREVSLIATENSVDAARLALIKLLEIGRHVKINPTEQITINEDMVLNAKELKETAFKNRIDFLTSNLNLEIAKMNLGQAKNNMLPDLSLTGGYRHNRTFTSDESYSPSQSENWDAGIKFTVPLRDLTLKQGYLNAKINFKKTETGILQLKENIEIEVEDSIRTAEMKLRQVKLAKQANKLSRQKLDIENEKLKAGRSSNFQILTYQNDLVTSQNNELNAIIDYLNSITNLHKTTGTTLEGWGIKIAERYLDEKSLE